MQKFTTLILATLLVSTACKTNSGSAKLKDDATDAPDPSVDTGEAGGGMIVYSCTGKWNGWSQTEKPKFDQLAVAKFKLLVALDAKSVTVTADSDTATSSHHDGLYFNQFTGSDRLAAFFVELRSVAMTRASKSGQLDYGIDEAAHQANKLGGATCKLVAAPPALTADPPPCDAAPSQAGALKCRFKSNGTHDFPLLLKENGTLTFRGGTWTFDGNFRGSKTGQDDTRGWCGFGGSIDQTSCAMAAQPDVATGQPGQINVTCTQEDGGTVDRYTCN